MGLSAGAVLIFVFSILLSLILLLTHTPEIEDARAFHLEAEAHAANESRLILQSAANQLNATQEALRNANLTLAFFHLALAQQDLSTVLSGNSTIGMYSILPSSS